MQQKKACHNLSSKTMERIQRKEYKALAARTTSRVAVWNAFRIANQFNMSLCDTREGIHLNPARLYSAKPKCTVYRLAWVGLIKKLKSRRVTFHFHYKVICK